MRRWLLGGSALAVATVLASAAWFGPQPPVAEPLAFSMETVAASARQVAPSQPAPATFTVEALPVAAEAPAAIAPPALSPVEAQVLMQLMAEQGDPRMPAKGGLKPRQSASAAQLADPQAYAAFEDEQTRSQVQAWTRGVEQIPAIRERIAQAEQAGDRSSAELEEARAALGQLEQLHSQLQQQAPQLLPSGPAPQAPTD